MEEYSRLREQQVQRGAEPPNSTDSFHESHHVKSISWDCVARGLVWGTEEVWLEQSGGGESRDHQSGG